MRTNSGQNESFEQFCHGRKIAGHFLGECIPPHLPHCFPSTAWILECGPLLFTASTAELSPVMIFT